MKELSAHRHQANDSLSGCNWTWTHNYLVRKRTLNYLAKLASYFFVCFVMNVPNWNFKKYIFGHKFLKRWHFLLKLGHVTHFRFYIFLFFSKSTSGTVIPWEVDLHFCTWQAHFWNNFRESVKIYILNNTNLWKDFEEHFSEHFRCHIFQIKILKKIVSFIR